MTPMSWAIFLFVIGLVLLLAELLLPTHGLLGVLGVFAVIGSLVITFWINQWAGLVATLIVATAAPFFGVWAVRIWPRTIVGRRLVLQPLESAPQPIAVQIGQVGVAISELRPMGECEFGDLRIEASSELGMIAPGTKVKIVNIVDRRPVVRAASQC